MTGFREPTPSDGTRTEGSQALGPALIQDLVPYGIFTTDTELRFTSWNAWLVLHSGRSQDQVVGRHVAELFPDLGKSRMERLQAALRGEVSMLSAALHKYLLPLASNEGAGNTQPMLQTARIAPLTEEGHIVGTISVVEDVTQREIQAAILQRQQELDRLLSSALGQLLQSNDPAADVPNIFAMLLPVLGLDAYTCYLSGSGKRLLHLSAAGGFSPKQRETLSVLPLGPEPGEPVDPHTKPITATIRHHESVLAGFGIVDPFTYPLVIADSVIGLVSFGSYRRISLSAADRAVLSRLSRYVAIALDRTMREREILMASRAKDEFLAALSHELRTPLNPVLMLASDSAANPAFPREAREVFRVIEKNALLEARLIDDLLDLTRIERGKTGLESQLVDVHSVLKDALVTVRADAAERQLTVELDLRAQSSVVMADAARLQQVFWNVLKNAIKFTPAGGRIQVTSSADVARMEWRVDITDTGIGMEPHEVNRIFEAFTQGDHARLGRGHRFGGLGLGLAISRKLVELHSGRIEAQSAGRHQGATFTIYLPLTDAPAPEQTAALPAEQTPSEPPVPTGAAPASTARLLLVEDHQATRDSLARLLIKRGYKVTAVGTSAAALKAAEEETFDLVLSDIGLPDGDGFMLMATLRDRHKLKGLALTGYGMEEDIERSNAAGFVAHLTKPISVSLLDRTVAAGLAAPR